jgi:glycosyltransferase involved in cell wall biosynthesis
VCFVSPKSYPLFHPEIGEVFGGAEVDLYLLGGELARDTRFEVSFIVADYGQAAEEQLGPIRLIRSVNFRSTAAVGALRVWNACRKADADIYVIKTASAGMPLVAGYCRLHRRAFVYRTASQRESDGRYLADHPLLGRTFAWSLRHAAAVLSQNQTDRDNLLRTLGVESTVIPNGHPMPPLSDSPRDYVLWAGRSEAVKGPRRFLDLARALPDERFVMLCSRATGDEDFDRLGREAGQTPNLQWRPQVPFSETDAFFRRAKVLVNTSDSEGFANAFIQACKWAVPILSLAVNPDLFLTRHSCGLCVGGDETRLAEGLEFLLEGDRYVELGTNARVYAQRYHDIVRIVEQYKELFERLAASRVR